VRVQLKRHERICHTVTAFTAALLGTGTAGAAGAGKVDSSILIYSEVNRVTAGEGVVDFRKTLDERRSFSLRLTLDALTGASPNGATPSSHVQTFTGASGNVSYSAPAGEIPLDDTFKDQRGALDGTFAQSLDRLTIVNVGGHFSIEHDYTSVGINGGLSRDFNRRNTSVSVSGAYSYDTVSPIGGAPEPLSAMALPTPGDGEGEDEGEGGESGPGEHKDVADLTVGLSQVLGRQTLLGVNYSYSRSSGYLTDPYKIVSVVQDAAAAEPGEPVEYLYESRPSVRSKQAVYAGLRRYIAGSTVDLSYRYFWDDWGVVANTVDFLSRLPIGHGRALEPHVRWYRQSATDFHQYYLVQGIPLPQHVSADARLAAFDAWTAGLKFTFPVGEFDSFGVSAEYYTQIGERGPPNPVGILGQYDLFPALDVYMIRFGYTHGL
jgi:hypothetical protein